MTVRPEEPFQSILENVEEAVTLQRQPTIRTVIKYFGRDALGPILILCAIILLSPIGAIPGSGVVTFVLVVGFSLQALFRRRDVWLPKSIGKIEVNDEHVQSVTSAAQPWAKKLDAFVKNRMTRHGSLIARRVVAIICLFTSVLLIVLDPVPFGMILPAFTYACFGVGLTARDTYFLTAGFALSTVLIAIVFKTLFMIL